MEELLHKYFKGLLNDRERLNLLIRVDSDPALKQQFIEIKNIYALSTLSMQVRDKEYNRESYKQFEKRHLSRRIPPVIRKTISYAASVAFIIGLTYWFTSRQRDTGIGTEVEMYSLYVPAGQRFLFTLSDSSRVWINAHSTLRFPVHFGENERRVDINGEALFDVAKDPDRPFIVSSKGVNMEVLGTKFNVYSYSDAGFIRTSLLEGSLKVYKGDTAGENYILEPDQEITISEDGITIHAIEDYSYFLWTEGIYSFTNEPLANILRKLELYYDVKINVKDPSIYDWEYTGKFRQKDGIDDILRIIRKIHKFDIVKDEENNIITLSKPEHV